MRAPLRLIAVIAPAVLASACVSSNLSFRIDKWLHITTPKNRSAVSLPVQVAWTIRDFDVKSSPSGTGGSFGVFFDRTPVPPGKPLSWLARNDTTCHATPRCPDAAYLARLGVYQTTDTHLELSALPDGQANDSGAKTRHFVTIILLDDQGKRVGEIAYNVDFELKRKGS